MIQRNFRRIEVKYLLTPEQADGLMSIIEPYLKKDDYFKETNLSVYYDTKDLRLGVQSLEKPLYKEKVRVRAYEVPKDLNENVFVEIKKKYKGIGYKRRIPMSLFEFYEFCDSIPERPTRKFSDTPQIEDELRYCFEVYQLKPILLIAYDRSSYVNEEDPTFRLTFDRNLRYRTDDLHLEFGDQGEKYFEEEKIVMEVKSALGYPLWFTRALAKLKIYPTSFSKYNKVLTKIGYNNIIKEVKNV